MNGPELDPATLWRLYGQGSAQFWRAAPNSESRLTAHSALVLSGEPNVDMNFAIIDAGDDAELRLREFVERLRERKLPAQVVLSDAVADELDATAHELGLTYDGTMPLMVRGVEESPRASADFAVERVVDIAGLRDMARIVAGAFEIPDELCLRAVAPAMLAMPDVEVFVARGEDTAVSAVVTTATGGAVGVWAMATLPDHERRGAGAAVLGAALEHHRPRADAFFLGASCAGRPLYERLGFRIAVEGASWVCA